MKKWFETIEKPILGLAPMHQVSRAPLRKACIKAGADVTFSEMVSSEAVIRKIPVTMDMIKFSQAERPYVVQIFGNNPEAMAEAAKYIENEFSPDGIDINFGCPVQKAEKQGFGSCQLKDPQSAGKIIRAIKRNVKKIPVSAKLRAVSKDPQDTIRFVGEIKKAGIDLVSIHGRTPTQKYRGEADWTIAYEVKKRFPDLPVLGNGDIKSRDDLQNKIGNLDGVLVGRAAKVKPEIFRELKEIKKSR